MEKEYRKLATYNRIRILEQVEKMLENKYNAKILRSIYQKPLEIQCYTMETDEEKRKRIEELKPIIAPSKWLDLNLLINGYYIAFDFDDNPFFPITYEKIKVNENGEYIGRRYLESTEDNLRDTLHIHLCYDAIFTIITDEQVKELAEDFVKQISGYIENGHESEPYNEKKRVPNYYDNGYHYERIYDKEKCCIYNVNTNGGNGQYMRKE